MVYVISSEKAIPLPSESVDVMFTLNAMDHVVNFGVMLKEIVRVLRPGGYFYGSFNLNEPPTFSEPQTLTKSIVIEHVQKQLQIMKCTMFPGGPKGDLYRHCAEDCAEEIAEECFLWIRARKGL